MLTSVSEMAFAQFCVHSLEFDRSIFTFESPLPSERAPCMRSRNWGTEMVILAENGWSVRLHEFSCTNLAVLEANSL